MMLWDATGDPTPQPLTKELLQQLLRFYFSDGELAEDEILLDEMLNVAKGGAESGDDEEPIIFNQYTFVRALTHDVQRYNIDNENSQNTNYVDVFETYYSTKSEENKKCSCPKFMNPMKTVEVGSNNEEGTSVQRVFT